MPSYFFNIGNVWDIKEAYDSLCRQGVSIPVGEFCEIGRK